MQMWSCSPQNLLFNEQEEEIYSLQQRVDLLENTCREKDKITMKYQENLDCLNEQDQAMLKMQEQQKDLVPSLLANVRLDQTTKFIQGTHKLR